MAAKQNQATPAGCLVLFIATAIILAIGTFATSNHSSGSSGVNIGDKQIAAFSVCKDFVKDRLKSPTSAKFRNEFQDDGEVSITGVGDTYTVVSSVDADNSFGASIRQDFTCTVQNTSGDLFTLVSLTGLDD